MTYRTGNHPGTIAREGQASHTWRPFNLGNTVCAEVGCVYDEDEHPGLVAVVVNGDQALAERICALLNGDKRSDPAVQTVKSYDADGRLTIHFCTCDHDGLDEMFHLRPCPIAEARIARRRKTPPPPVGPGCICDGSGRTCPRHGTVI